MNFEEIQAQIESINKQLATVVQKADDRKEIEEIKDRLQKVEKSLQQTKHDQTSDRIMAALRQERGY